LKVKAAEDLTLLR